MSAPTASIITPTRGGAARLPYLLESLSHQDTDDWELVVVIDGDIDDSERVIRHSKIPLKVVVFDENRGRSAALNAGFDVAEGEVLIRCDDDLDLSISHVSGHIAAHRDGAPRGVIGVCRNVFPDTAYARAYGVPAERRQWHAARIAPPDQRWRYWGANVSVTRERWMAVGAYDETYRGYGWEDIDWGYRLHRSGAQIILDPALEAGHRVHAITTRTRVDRAFQSGTARAGFERRHGLPAASNGGSGAWNHLVAAAARSGPRALSVLASGCDAMLPALPLPAAQKAVAVLVEAAGLAGYDAARADQAAIGS